MRSLWTVLVVVACGLLACGLASCATAPQYHLVAPAHWKGQVSSFELVPSPGGSDFDKALTEAIRQKLMGHGWRDGGEDGEWKVQVAYSERPARYGVYSDETARQGQWHTAPKRVPFWSKRRVEYGLSLSLDTATNREGPFVSQATVVSAAGESDRLVPDLIETAVAPLINRP